MKASGKAPHPEERSDEGPNVPASAASWLARSERGGVVLELTAPKGPRKVATGGYRNPSAPKGRRNRLTPIILPSPLSISSSAPSGRINLLCIPELRCEAPSGPSPQTPSVFSARSPIPIPMTAPSPALLLAGEGERQRGARPPVRGCQGGKKETSHIPKNVGRCRQPKVRSRQELVPGYPKPELKDIRIDIPAGPGSTDLKFGSARGDVIGVGR